MGIADYATTSTVHSPPYLTDSTRPNCRPAIVGPHFQFAIENAGLLVIEIVGAALVADGRVLLGLRAAHKTHAGCWDLVGGHMEVGETQWSALSREVMEELGIEILGGSYISSLTLPALPHRSAVMHVYSIHEWRGEPSLQNDEHAAINWFSLLDAGNLTNLALPEYPELFASLSAGTP